MKNGFALAAGISLMISSAAFADTTVEATTSNPGSMTQTTIKTEQPAAAPIVVAPAPSVQKTKIKSEKHSLFGRSKIKSETTTVTP